MRIEGIQLTHWWWFTVQCALYNMDNAAKMTVDSWILSEVGVRVKLLKVCQHYLIAEFILVL